MVFREVNFQPWFQNCLWKKNPPRTCWAALQFSALLSPVPCLQPKFAINNSVHSKVPLLCSAAWNDNRAQGQVTYCLLQKSKCLERSTIFLLMCHGFVSHTQFQCLQLYNFPILSLNLPSRWYLPIQIRFWDNFLKWWTLYLYYWNSLYTIKIFLQLLILSMT